MPASPYGLISRISKSPIQINRAGAKRCAGGRLLGFVTGFFGNAVSADRATAILAGAAMLAVFAALALALVARRSGADHENRRLMRAGPWLVIGALPLSQAILATYGRLPHGLDHAFRDDYALTGFSWRSPSPAWRSP